MNVTGKLKVNKIKVNDKNVQANGYESKKKQDDTWETKWFNLKFVGKAKELAETLQDKEKINITSAILDTYTTGEGEARKTYTNIVVFEFEKVETTDGLFTPINDDSDDIESIFA